jgi:hypothetical protein
VLSFGFLVDMCPSVTAAASAASRNLSCTDSFGDRSSGCVCGLDSRFLVCRKLLDLAIDGCDISGGSQIKGK